MRVMTSRSQRSRRKRGGQHPLHASATHSIDGLRLRVGAVSTGLLAARQRARPRRACSACGAARWQAGKVHVVVHMPRCVSVQYRGGCVVCCVLCAVCGSAWHGAARCGVAWRSMGTRVRTRAGARCAADTGNLGGSLTFRPPIAVGNDGGHFRNACERFPSFSCVSHNMTRLLLLFAGV